eukprot:6296634-Prymnesium_polylepis.2
MRGECHAGFLVWGRACERSLFPKAWMFDERDEKKQRDHCHAKEEKEKEEVVTGVAKSVFGANLCGRAATLDQEHTRVYEDESKLNQGHQCSILGSAQHRHTHAPSPSKVRQNKKNRRENRTGEVCSHPPTERFDREVQRQEEDADEEGDEDASLLGLLLDQQDRSGECELANHFERLPPESGRNIIAREERGRLAERRRHSSQQRFTAQPKQHGVEHRNPHWPEHEHSDRGGARLPIQLRIAAQGQIVMKVPPLDSKILVVRECLA